MPWASRKFGEAWSMPLINCNCDCGLLNDGRVRAVDLVERNKDIELP